MTFDISKLGNGEFQHEQHPDTFWIPDGWKRHNLEVGQIVKLWFNLPERVERMWVKITNVMRDEDGGIDCYFGRLDNDPIGSGIKCGDMVKFLPLHVINIWEEES